MDCIAEPAAASAQPDPTVAAHSLATPTATLCMNCEVRVRCLGGIAAEAGTAQLQGILAGRIVLRAREVLYEPDDPFTHVHAVRSGALTSVARRDDGQQAVGFHFPGEVVGVDGMATGRQRVAVVALEETQLCAMRFAPRGNEPAGVRSLLARLWDMMSCELVRERAHQSLLSTLPPEKRVAAFLASVSRRRRGRKAGRLPLGMGPGEIGGYLGVPPEVVQDAISRQA